MPIDNTLTPIQTITVGAGGAASIEFTNIPQNYTDLCLKYSLKSERSSTWDEMRVKFNNSGGTAYSERLLYGNGASAGSASGSSGAYNQFGIINGNTSTANTFGNGEIYIPNYAGSNNKSYYLDSVQETNATTAFIYLDAGLWANSSAINQITLTSNNGFNFVQHSSATLYGVKSFVGDTGGKAIGGTVTSDSNYWYHTFTTSGTFTPTQSLNADILVVAGGGGGGHGGGGGAGGLLAHTSQSLTSTNYSVLVGAGGVSGGWSNPQRDATNGGNSIFGSLTASVGGGRGGVYDSTANGGSGGSGGGAASGQTGTTYNGGAGTSGQGNNGGNQPTATSNQGSGGGGGAGAAGANASGTSGGNGGAGVSTYSSWGLATSSGQNVSGTYWFAGGGGGTQGPGTSASCGSGGNGGGGGTTLNQNGSSGSNNTGGGGGGGSWPANLGGNGGSGIVIIRYAK